MKGLSFSRRNRFIRELIQCEETPSTYTCKKYLPNNGKTPCHWFLLIMWGGIWGAICARYFCCALYEVRSVCQLSQSAFELCCLIPFFFVVNCYATYAFSIQNIILSVFFHILLNPFLLSAIIKLTFIPVSCLIFSRFVPGNFLLPPPPTAAFFSLCRLLLIFISLPLFLSYSSSLVFTPLSCQSQYTWFVAPEKSNSVDSVLHVIELN